MASGGRTGKPLAATTSSPALAAPENLQLQQGAARPSTNSEEAVALDRRGAARALAVTVRGGLGGGGLGLRGVEHAPHVRARMGGAGDGAVGEGAAAVEAAAGVDDGRARVVLREGLGGVEALAPDLDDEPALRKVPRDMSCSMEWGSDCRQMRRGAKKLGRTGKIGAGTNYRSDYELSRHWWIKERRDILTSRSGLFKSNL